ncbi:MAG: 16S rRNA (cytosine(1402)-N(4))-methyltransferase RsmH [Desulfomonilaceae bacterium]
MLTEMIDYLRPCPHGVYLDGTLGAGGYAERILRASEPDGKVVGLDLDSEAVVRTKERLKEFETRFNGVHAGFHEAKTILKELGISAVDGAVLDLGISSEQLEDPKRGFSFRSDGALDMRFDNTAGQPLTEYLWSISTQELEQILSKYGEERYFRRLVKAILESRDRGKLRTAQDLAEVVSRSIGSRRGKIHPATRTFQALRIAVNRELDNLKIALEEIPLLLKTGGRFCVVSYHSLEDRAVKLSFKERKKQQNKWLVVTPKPIRPTAVEIKLNPRARSARMRVLEAL